MNKKEFEIKLKLMGFIETSNNSCLYEHINYEAISIGTHTLTVYSHDDRINDKGFNIYEEMLEYIINYKE